MNKILMAILMMIISSLLLLSSLFLVDFITQERVFSTGYDDTGVFEVLEINHNGVRAAQENHYDCYMRFKQGESYDMKKGEWYNITFKTDGAYDNIIISANKVK